MNRHHAEAIVASGINHRDVSVSFKIFGTPPSQQRPRSRYFARVQRTVFYDPTANLKTIFARAIKLGLNLDNAALPIYGDATTKFKMEVMCYLTNVAKDVDNLLKFVMDVLQVIVYLDDKMVYKAAIEKKQVARLQDQKTTIHISILN